LFLFSDKTQQALVFLCQISNRPEGLKQEKATGEALGKEANDPNNIRTKV